MDSTYLREKEIFDDIDGNFIARLREIHSNTRSTTDGKATITFKTARIEANYSPNIIKNIEAGRLIAIPNVMGLGSKDTYSIYEVADIYPMHYSMLTLDRNQPSTIRKEFMTLIEREWEVGTKNTWIEIVGAPTGYIMITGNDRSEQQFIRKNLAPLTGAEVHLLSKDTIQKFICYSSKKDEDELYTIGSLLGLTGQKVPSILNLEKLLHFHVGVFAFTGSGKSNLTSLIIRKAIRSIPDLKFVIFDISSEYGINLMDLLRKFPSRVTLLENLRGTTITDQSIDYFRKHVCPESLEEMKFKILESVEEIITSGKIKKLSIPSEAKVSTSQYSTYGGLLSSVAELTNDRYQASSQKVLIPPIIDMINEFMEQRELDETSRMGSEIASLLKSINDYLQSAELRTNATLSSIFKNLQLALERDSKKEKSHSDKYDVPSLISELMQDSTNSPRLFVINLPEAEVARTFCANVINTVFKERKNNFSLFPKIVFVFDEAQEFIPYEKKKEDGTEHSSRAVERLLRHGRKYNLHGWISTQRIAHLNTNVLQQLHSYFVSTMPRPYDRQLISDTFAIDDAFIERTLMFQNGDWLMTSFKATNTQNVPVFFHAYNNEDAILD